MLIVNIILIIGMVGLIKAEKKLFEYSLLYGFLVLVSTIGLMIKYKPIMNVMTEEKGIGGKEVEGSMHWLGSIVGGGIDGLSIIMICLTTLLIILCVITGEKIKYRRRLFYVLLFVTEIAVVNLFATNDLLYFYIMFEAVLIPMFIIIGVWGSRKEKISAAYQFFIYTLLGSLFMLLSIISIFIIIGTTNVWEIKGYQFNLMIEKIFWISFFLSFAIKIPMYPFHLWLPKAHVEAPTAGSVLLAGILLKLGAYGFIRFSLFLFPMSTIYYRPFIILLALIGVIYSSFTILRQIDLKRIVAYSSIAHMNIVILGCFSGNIIALEGAILLMMAHGLVSGGLFLCVGCLYDRYKSRNILYFRDLKTIMPYFGTVFFIFMLGNLGFPPTLNFLSEFLIVSGFFEAQQSLVFLIGIALFLAAVSGFLTYTRLFFGSFSITKGYTYIINYYDLTRREFFSMIPLVFLTFYFGLFPNVLINLSKVSLASWGI